MLRLHERGMVDLDAPVSAYLPPELSRGLHVLDGVDHTERITPTHLLGHLTGLPDALQERPRGEHSEPVWLWHCPQLDLMLAGTVDQTTAVTVPFRPVPNALAGLAE